MNPIKHYLKRAVFVASALVVFASTAQAQETRRTADPDRVAANLAQHLGLSEAGQQALAQALAENDGQQRQPGFLWHLAADLERTLPPSDLDRLMSAARTNTRSTAHTMPRERAGDGRKERAGRAAHDRASEHARDLSPEQQEEMREIQAEHREQMRELQEDVRSGELTEEQARARRSELRDEMRAEMREVLTPEQRARMDGAREHARDRGHDRAERGRGDMPAGRFAAREYVGAAQAAMADALNLTAEQRAELDRLQQEHMAGARQRGGEARTQGHGTADVQSAYQRYVDAVENILTPDQREIFRIHHALASGLASARFNRGGM